MNAARIATRGGRAGGRRAACLALLLAAAGCAVPVPPVADLEPGQSPMVTGQSPGSPFTDGGKETPYSSQNSYPVGAASPVGRGR